MTLILAQQDRGITWDVGINDTDGNPITVADDDKLRAIITRIGKTAELTVTSDAATAAGSSFTPNAATNTHRLRLDATDLGGIEPGVYTLIIDFLDDADAEEWKNVDRQVISIEDS